jgi:hypothetical protein
MKQWSHGILVGIQRGVFTDGNRASFVQNSGVLLSHS